MSLLRYLYEIGEHFGKHVDDRTGTKTSYSQRIRDITNIEYQNLNVPQQNANNPKNTFLSGPLSKSFRWSDDLTKPGFYEWQKKVISELEQKNDVYVVAPPGGGKTTPLMAYYMINVLMGGRRGSMDTLEPEKVFDLNNVNNQVVEKWSSIFSSILFQKKIDGSNAPKVLFITPIRVLAFEQAEKFQEYLLDLIIFLKSIIVLIPENERLNDQISFADLMIQFKNHNSTLKKIIGNVFEKNKDVYDIFAAKVNENNNSRFETWAKKFTLESITVKTGGGSDPFNSRPENALMTIATYGSAKNFISSIVNTVKFIVFDEAHLYQISEYGGIQSQNQAIMASSDAYQIIHIACRNKNIQLAFLSGTINPISAKNFCNYLNKKYQRRMESVETKKGDPQAVNKTELKVIPDDSLQNDKLLIKKITQWIIKNQSGNAVIIFSKKIINDIVEKVKQQLSQQGIMSITSKKTSSDSFRQGKIDAYRHKLKYTHPNASQHEIDRLVKKYTEENFPDSQMDKIRRIQNLPSANNIQNKELREAVSFGIGYIYRQDSSDLTYAEKKAGKEEISENDKKIVANLFSTGKIPVLLATSSIGIGVNVSIKSMYIPSLYTFDKGDKQFGGSTILINKRELSQLINRTGRGKTDVSGIYTPNEFVNYVRDVISMTPDDYNEVPAITCNPSDSLKNVLISLSSAVKNNVLEQFKNVDYTPITSPYNKLKTFLRNQFASHEERNQRIQQNQQQNINNVMQNAQQHLQQVQADIARLQDYNNLIGQYSDFATINQNIQQDIDRIEQRINQQINDLHNVILNLGNAAPNWQQQRDRYLITITRLEQSKILLFRAKINFVRNIISEIDNRLNYYQNNINNQNHIEFSHKISTLTQLKNNYIRTESRLTRRSELTDQITSLRRTEQTISDQLNQIRRLPNVNPEVVRSVEIHIRGIQQAIRDCENQIRTLNIT